MEASKINYTSTDGIRSQVTLDGKLVDVWLLATGRRDLSERGATRLIAEDVVPRALRVQSEDLTKTKRIERELLEDIAVAIQQDMIRRDPDQPDLLA